jgi:hypothetical protein
MVFKANDPNYILVGTDGGIYETFDDTENWKFVNNLPLTQFYKLAVDDAYPFYNIFGGTQDNNTQGGPSQTFNRNGISNADWFVLLGGDGHQPATEPGNPDIVYAQSQQGNLHRVDRTTGEAVYIRPQNGLDEPYERFNWDAPILVSQHDPKRIYFGSQRVWRSENRGDSWNPISSDLTKNEERLALPIMGRQQSWDAAWDVYAMSTYNTITSLAESAQDENILYAGTDDGLLHATKDGGATWSTQTVDKLLQPLSMISKPICLMPMLPMWHWTTTNLVTIAPCSTRQQMAASHGNPLQRVFQMERSYGDWFKITLIHNCCF